MNSSRSKQYDVITFGGAVRDIIFFSDKGRLFRTPEDIVAQKMLAFELGAKIPISHAYYTFGGGAVNTAHIFSKLGLRTAITARVGDDEDASTIARSLRSCGISTPFLQRDPSQKTGFSFILSTPKFDREHIVFTYRGANDCFEVSDKKHSYRAKWYYISSLCGSHWLKTLKNILSLAKKNAAKVAWNPGSFQIQAGKKSIEKILKNVDVLILNKDEAIELVLSGIKLGRRSPKFLNNTVYLLNILNEWGPETVIITEGSHGASALFQEKVHRVKAYRISQKRIVDTTGVGDAFAATFIAARIYENDIDSALKLAAINSAHVLTKIGAHEGACTYDELLKKAHDKKNSLS